MGSDTDEKSQKNFENSRDFTSLVYNSIKGFSEDEIKKLERHNNIKLTSIISKDNKLIFDEMKANVDLYWAPDSIFYIKSKYKIVFPPAFEICVSTFIACLFIVGSEESSPINNKLLFQAFIIFIIGVVIYILRTCILSMNTINSLNKVKSNIKLFRHTYTIIATTISSISYNLSINEDLTINQYYYLKFIDAINSYQDLLMHYMGTKEIDGIKQSLEFIDCIVLGTIDNIFDKK